MERPLWHVHIRSVLVKITAGVIIIGFPIWFLDRFWELEKGNSSVPLGIGFIVFALTLWLLLYPKKKKEVVEVGGIKKRKILKIFLTALMLYYTIVTAVYLLTLQ